MKKLWSANKSQIINSNLFNYENYISKRYKTKFNKNYNKILNWSTKNSNDFWDSIWDYCKVKGIKGKIKRIKSKKFYKNLFLADYKLNFAENILSKNNHTKAITFISENGYKEERSWRELNANSKKIISFLKQNKIKSGERVCAYLPNIIETVEYFIATSAIGAIWSSCSPDFGVRGVIERFAQIKPKVLIIADRYYYNGKEINVIERLPEILNKIKSIKRVVVLNYPGKKLTKFKKVKSIKFFYSKDIKKIKQTNHKLKKFSFNHPLAVLYSSGTTGKPKCICHRAGGVLLQHLKEHQLHCEIKPEDNIFYFTTCGWMMWNWLVSSLASKASIVLFDGFPMYKKNDLLFNVVDKENVTLLGVSAKYIDSLKKLNITIKNKFKLKKLKVICSTGSPLSEEGFEYIYKKVKNNVHLSSISGGTDIVSCFVLGNIYQPVYSGEIQANGLGLNVKVFSDKGKPKVNEKGELVCTSPFPCVPIKFWGDKNNKKFEKAYFKRFKNTWHHGDYALKTKRGGYIIYGRSDATLNPGGVRLGTAEIYSEVEKFREIKESIVVGQSWDNDVRIILFVILNNKYDLNENLKQRLKKQIRYNASPRHVPSKIIQVSDIPRTKNGKIVELAVKNTIEGNQIKNKEALANPKILDEFKYIKELKN
tara:strand:- start:488 stop:2443 length:1956 start_codon:yes stop_codon:yes gene_type:complete